MLACLLGEQNGDWTLRFCKNICFWLLFWVGQPEWEGGHGVNSTVIRPVELSAGLEGVAGKASKPEDFGFALNFRLTVATSKMQSRRAKTATEPRVSDGRRSGMRNLSFLLLRPDEVLSFIRREPVEALHIQGELLIHHRARTITWS